MKFYAKLPLSGQSPRLLFYNIRMRFCTEQPPAGISSPGPAADFGFADVAAAAKTGMVGEVFSQVAPYYDRMNDLMSAGLHRWWKNTAVLLCGARPGMRVLDLACGSGDLAMRLLPRIRPGGLVTLADINAEMLAVARQRLPQPAARFLRCNGESLPFAAASFDRVIIGFGLRNITNRQAALAQMRRVLKPGGLCLIMEFSPPQGLLAPLQREYLTRVLPQLGRRFFNDEASYHYLGESILRFPDRDALSAMMIAAGFARVECLALPGGMAVLHRGRRLQ